MFGKRFTRALVVATTASLVMAATTFAAANLEESAIVGDASVSPTGATLVRGGLASTFSLDVTASEGNISTGNCDGTKNKVTIPTNYTITATGLSVSGTQSLTLSCTGGRNFTHDPETITFTNLSLSAGTDAPLGYSSRVIDFASVATLGQQVNLGTVWANPTVYATVNPRPASNLAATAISTSQIDLSWAASPDSADITGYVITQTGGASTTLSAAANATSLNVTALNHSTEYCFTIKARFTDSNSVNFDSASAPSSGPVCATTLAPVVTTTMTGFYAPVKAENKAKAGQAIALKWELWNGATEITDTAGVSVKFLSIPCGEVTDPSILGTDAADDAGTSGLRYDTADGQFVFAWKTAKSFTGCIRAQVVKDNTVLGYADFQFTK